MHRNSVASQFFLDHQEELAIQALKGPLNLEGIKFLSLSLLSIITSTLYN